MKQSNANYRSFLIRAWREDRAEALEDAASPGRGESPPARHDSAGSGWLFQAEDISSGEKRYFSEIGSLTAYVDEKLEKDKDHP